MSEIRRGPDTPLSLLIRQRMAEREWTYKDVQANAKLRGEVISHSTVYALAANYKRHHAPYARTLKALAAGLELPYDVVAEAAAQAAGYHLQEINVPLRSASTLRVIAAVHEELTEDQQVELQRLAEQYAAELKARRLERQNGS